jgi:hypothetical protein
MGADLGVLKRDGSVTVLAPDSVRHLLYADTNQPTLENTRPTESQLFNLLASVLGGG